MLENKAIASKPGSDRTLGMAAADLVQALTWETGRRFGEEPLESEER